MTDMNGGTPPTGTPGQQPPDNRNFASQPPYQPGQGTGTVAVQQKPHGLRTFLIAFAGALVACLIALGGFGLYNMVTGSGSGGSSSTVIGSDTSTSIDAEDAESDLTLAEAVAEKCLPSVVNIDVYTSQSSSMYGYSYGYSGSGSSSGTLVQSSLGSGVVLTDDGYIITNYHVVDGADALKVTIEGVEYDAEYVGGDSSSDIAVIKAQNVSGLTAIELGDSDNLIIGEWVMTIGSPYGYEQSVATGIVSATSRSQIMSSQTDGSTTIYPNMIQTDAAINSGNSGGALVDSDGKLIGINTLITSSSGSYSGVGFAIPVNYAANIAQQIIDGETPTHAQLGVSLSTVNAQVAERYGLSVDTGAYITAVNSGSGAEAAGLQVGDIVTKFDGQAVESASDLMLDVRSKNPGDVVSIEYNRNGETKTVDVTLGSDGSSEEASTQQNSSSSSLLDRLLGGGSSSSGSGSSGA